MNYFMLYCCSSVLTRHAAEVNSLRRTALGATLQVLESFCVSESNRLEWTHESLAHTRIGP